MPDEPIDFLMKQARRFRDRVDLLRIEEQLGSDNRNDRMDSALFTVYHLLISGAVAEEGISQFLGEKNFPPIVADFADQLDLEATHRAWRGTSFDEGRNIIGSLAFLVVVLFLFEGFVKLVFEEELIRRTLAKRGPIGVAAIVEWLREKTTIDREALRAVDFLNRYRNAWHAFGYYGRESIEWNGVRLVQGSVLPVIHSPVRLGLLGHLLDVFLEVDRLRNRP